MTDQLPLPLIALGDHIVDPSGWTVAKCYGDYADEYANLIVTAVNLHANTELIAAAKKVLTTNDDGEYDPDAWEALKVAIAAAEAEGFAKEADFGMNGPTVPHDPETGEIIDPETGKIMDPNTAVWINAGQPLPGPFDAAHIRAVTPKCVAMETIEDPDRNLITTIRTFDVGDDQ